jgi:hypothetical protein
MAISSGTPGNDPSPALRHHPITLSPRSSDSSPPPRSGAAKFAEALMMTVSTGAHAPPQVRATRPLRNDDALFATFEIVAGDPMFRATDKHVVIW